jgi:hypothetical protein
LGQLDVKENTVKRVTFKSIVTIQEYTEDSDQILETLETGEIDESQNGVDFDLSNVQSQILEMEGEIGAFTFTNKIEFSKSNSYTNLNAFNSNQDLEIPDAMLYNLESTDSRHLGILKVLSLTMGKINIIVNFFNFKTNFFEIYLKGGKELPRHSCANHKLSVVMNSAFLKQGFILDILKTLTAANASIRKSICENRIFRNLKCRPRIYQKTRWCGAILLLLSNKRAFDKGAYDEANSCPIAFEVIETYIQILRPAYFTTLGWEKNSSSIADVIPQVLFLIDYWTKIEINDPKARELCYFLIHYTKIKCNYELNSPVYQVIYFTKKYFLIIYFISKSLF